MIHNHDLDQMSYKINALLNDKEMRERFGNAGREKALRLFSLDSCANNMSDVYNQIMHSQTIVL